MDAGGVLGKKRRPMAGHGRRNGMAGGHMSKSPNESS